MRVPIIDQILGVLLLDDDVYKELGQDRSYRPYVIVYITVLFLVFRYIPLNGLSDVIYLLGSAFVFSLVLWFILTSVFYASSLFFGGRPGIQSYGSLIGYSMTPLTLCVLPYPGAVAGMTWFIACLVQATWVAGRMKLLNAVLAVFIPVLVVSLSVYCGLLPYDEEMLRNSWRTPYGYGKRSGWASF
jgi:hypothetical protein